MKYCLSQALSPSSMVINDPSQQNEIFMFSLVYATLGIFIILGLYIIFKMCQLCSKAFSYSNFHIHQAYKFYTLALISTISNSCIYLVILVSRIVQLQFADKITYANLHPDQTIPFNKDPFYQGWIIFNQIMGIISIYTVNLMYALSSITWLMISHKCDYNSLDQNNYTQEEQERQRQQQKKNHTFYIRLRTFLLYIFLPITMLLSVCLQLGNSQGSCLSSKLLLSITNLIVFLIFFYSLVDILQRRFRDSKTPLKIKIIWGYLIVAMTIRQIASWALQIQDLAHPNETDYELYSGQSRLSSNILIFIYSIGITTVPIFLLSYLADKQLEIEKTQIQRSQRIIYTSTII